MRKINEIRRRILFDSGSLGSGHIKKDENVIDDTVLVCSTKNKTLYLANGIYNA